MKNYKFEVGHCKSVQNSGRMHTIKNKCSGAIYSGLIKGVKDEKIVGLGLRLVLGLVLASATECWS